MFWIQNLRCHVYIYTCRFCLELPVGCKKKKNLSVTENWEFSFQFPSHLVVKVSREAEALIVIMNETN